MVHKAGLLVILSAFLLNAQIMLNPNRSGILNPPAGGGGSYLTDSLQHYWVLDSLEDGSVDNWYDAVRNYRVTVFNDDSTFRPIKTGLDLIFDGDDWLRGTTGGGTLGNFDGQPISIELVIETVDTTTGQAFIAVRQGTTALTIGFFNNRFYAYPYDGSNSNILNTYSTSFLGRHHIVVTWDGDGTSLPTVYIDGSASGLSDVGDAEGDISGDTRIIIGAASTISEVPDGTSIPLVRVYNIVLTAQQVEDNYNSDSVQDLMP